LSYILFLRVSPAKNKAMSVWSAWCWYRRVDCYGDWAWSRRDSVQSRSTWHCLWRQLHARRQRSADQSVNQLYKTVKPCAMLNLFAVAALACSYNYVSVDQLLKLASLSISCLAAAMTSMILFFNGKVFEKKSIRP